MFSIALNNLCFSFESLIYVSKSKLYISDSMQYKKEEIHEAASDTLLIINWKEKIFN